MNTETAHGNWKTVKGLLKHQYTELTDEDLRYEEGKEDDLIDRIQRRTGRAREEIEKFLSEDCHCDFGPDARGEIVHPTHSPHDENARKSPPRRPRPEGLNETKFVRPPENWPLG